jgi:N-acyl-phosphatidylethanolamine-hydrolysing phospholipase D
MDGVSHLRSECSDMRTTRVIAGLFVLAGIVGCGMPGRMIERVLMGPFNGMSPAPHVEEQPLLQYVGCSVLWVGHATTVIQIHDRVIITDPLFTSTVGILAKRVVAPGINPAALGHVDATLVSHLHFDHFSYASLDMLPKGGLLCIPPDGWEYTPDLGFVRTEEALPWHAIVQNGVTITPVPVKHFGGRYGFDILWGRELGFTGYIIEYNGTTVFFAGDTGYDSTMFRHIGARWKIDVALIPIAPIRPVEMMKPIHADPEDALQIFSDLGARIMIPIHHSTFTQGLEDSLGSAPDLLRTLIRDRHLEEKVKILEIGERVVVK